MDAVVDLVVPPAPKILIGERRGREASPSRGVIYAKRRLGNGKKQHDRGDEKDYVFHHIEIPLSKYLSILQELPRRPLPETFALRKADEGGPDLECEIPPERF